MRVLRRFVLATQMTRAYDGRFPRRKVWRMYWRTAGKMLRDRDGS